MQVGLDAGGVARNLADHMAGVAGLAAWYGQHFEVGGEREVLSLERPSNLGGLVTAQLASFWSVRVPGHKGVHPPDMVAVGRHPQTGEPVRIAVELERAVKEPAVYEAVLRAYAEAGLPVVWHVLHARTGDRLAKAAMRVGHTWAASPARGVVASADGLIRMQGWRPGRILSDTASWAPRLNVPASVPAGLDAYAVPQTLDTWRNGTLVDPAAEPLWEPLEMYDAA